MAKEKARLFRGGLEKVPTGITGLDEITGGGLPKGRPTLVCGGAGSGKTLVGLEFLVRGATRFNEPGVFMSFEESAEELTKNVASLGFDLNRLTASKRLFIDYVHIERSEIEETGEYDLEGLFIRLGNAIDSIGAKRVVLDTIESLFAGLPNPSILRAELRRLFRWLKKKGMTAIITGERGDNALTRHGLEEYVSDCVILLDHRVSNQISTRRLRVVKYRGSTHGTNEFPFLIDERGIAVMPITSLGLQHIVTSQRISTGIPRLDTMLGGKGYFRGSSILVSGTAGTGKTSIAAHFVDAACRRGERCIFFAFEESPSQIIRNMRSIGIDLGQWVKKGLLKFHAERPTVYGLEAHLASMHKLIDLFKPKVVIVDPVTNLSSVASETDVKAMLVRLLDEMKFNHITTLFTTLTAPGNTLEQTEVGMSSLADTWLLLRDIEIGGERNRGLYILKSRGMAHSNQIREFLLTDKGVDLIDVYVGPSGVLTGSARMSQETQERGIELAHQQEIERRKENVETKRKALEAQIASLRAQFQAEEQELKKLTEEEKMRQRSTSQLREKMARLRKEDANSGRRTR
ncbi:MAG TPA: circadian clock protein KaiC [Thermodesulfobacteriota bacterium]|nr:circadian clock protein KaiC [Thermodesulfobacteriota bacterium]